MVKQALIKRGLNDLMSENEIRDLEKEEVIEISLEKIRPNPFQPRKHFDETALAELAESIKTNGVLQPVIVKKIADGYMLVTGERRCKASQLAGFSTVPAIVRDYNNQYLAELALLENIQREDLTIMEEAQAYQFAIETLHLTHLELAEKIGKSRSYVSNTLGILSLPASVIDEVNQGNLSMGHARALSKLKDINRIKAITSLIIEHQLTVRDIEQIVKKEKKKKQIKRKENDPLLTNELHWIKSNWFNDPPLNSRVDVKHNQLVFTFDDLDSIERFKAWLNQRKES